jgi:hypothetical protein
VRAPALLALLAGMGLCACATSRRSDFIPRSVHSGVVEWRRDANALAARASFETGVKDGFRLEVRAKSPLLILTRSGGEWMADGPLAGREWRGVWNTAPAMVGDWICVVEAFEGAAFAPPGGSDVRTGRFAVRYAKRGDELRNFELVVVATGDRFRVTFLGGLGDVVAAQAVVVPLCQARSAPRNGFPVRSRAYSAVGEAVRASRTRPL